MITQYSDIPYEIFTIDCLYSEKELLEFYNYVKDADPSNRSFTIANFKNGKIINPDWSKLMYNRIKPYLPKIYIDRLNKTYICRKAIKYIMYSAISKDQMFQIHTDTGYEYDEKKNNYSKYTVLTYLNDDFEGGNTIFYDNNFNQIIKIKPKKGLTLLFDIDFFHSGEKVINNTKYWIGTEIVCYLSN